MTHPGYPLHVLPHPALRATCGPVGERLASMPEGWRQIIGGMAVTMRAYRGVGIAAPQVGMLVRAFVTDKPNDGTPSLPDVLIDPTVELLGDRREVGPEGCLSLPGERYEVSRATYIRVAYRDLDGHEHSVSARGFAARVLQHELDHLDGVLIDTRALEFVKSSRTT